MRILVIGGTGYLGSKIAGEAIRAGHEVSALVRATSDANGLKHAGVSIIHGDITDAHTLPSALAGIDAVITSAAGYTNRKSGDSLDTVDNHGNRNLADAVLKAKVKHFVFISVLKADDAQRVPHFHQKFLSEQYFQSIGLPFVSLRPGGFLDQVLDRSREELTQGRLGTVLPPKVPLTCILSDDVARFAVASLLIPDLVGEHVDLGMEKPLTFHELARELSRSLGREIELQDVSNPALFVAPIDDSTNASTYPEKTAADTIPTTSEDDMTASLAYMGSGKYVADVSKQKHFFGSLPTLTDSVNRWVADTHLLKRTS